MPHIIFPARILETVTALNFIRDHLGLGRGSIRGYMEMAVEELLVNIVQYSYPDMSPDDIANAAPSFFEENPMGGRGRVELGLRYASLDGEPCVCVWLRDWGVPFDPFHATHSEDAGEGLGVMLARNASAHRIYSSSDGANTVELYFPDPVHG